MDWIAILSRLLLAGVFLVAAIGKLADREGSRQALGQTGAGRYLRVVYVPDEDRSGVFIVTAYPLTGRALQLPKPHHDAEAYEQRQDEYGAGENALYQAQDNLHDVTAHAWPSARADFGAGTL